MLISHTPETTPDFSHRGAGVDWKQHNVGVTPVFFTDKAIRKNADGTETEIDIECVTIVVAGDDLTEASQPVDDQIRERFAAQYEAWKSGTEMLSGTPITEWKLITARQAAFLQTLNIFTVEALSELSDYNVSNVHDGRALRDKAARWLKTACAANIADENAKMKAQLAEMKAELAALKPKRPKMSQAQRDRIAETMKARWAKVLPADTASVTDPCANPAGGQPVLSPVWSDK
ncbi:MAG: hypothetical protein CR217_06050 [Beijerinckiaceae bacterium]|nr:MAG: hypothetical protein CR217_06050 [Beijerinckiaceae bacterium]